MGWCKLGANEGALILCAAQGLTTLKMGWCKLGVDEGALRLCVAQGLTTLKVGWCKLGADEGALRLCVAQGLTTLKMGWCKLGTDEGAKAVADLLMFNTTLAALDLRGNGLGDAGAATQARPRKPSCTAMQARRGPAAWLPGLRVSVAGAWVGAAPCCRALCFEVRQRRRQLPAANGLRIQARRGWARAPRGTHIADVPDLRAPPVCQRVPHAGGAGPAQARASWRARCGSTPTTRSRSWTWATTRSRTRAHAQSRRWACTLYPIP